MAERLFGLPADEMRIAMKVIRREGLKSRAGTTVKYPKPLPDEHYLALGKPTANVTAPNTCTINIYTGGPGSETATGQQIEAYTYANLTSTKMCSLTRINGHYYAGCYQS